MPAIDPNYNGHARLDAEIQRSGHTVWGFVIYRCTYASNQDWETLMTKLKDADLAENEDPRSALSDRLHDTLTYTVFEDKELEGASKEQVHKRFGDWVDSKPWETEQPTGCGRGASGRYEVCLMVDEAALKSVLDQPENSVAPCARDWDEEDKDQEGWVYALFYGPNMSEFHRENFWMRVTFDDLMIRWVELLRGQGWYREYTPHPDIASG
ncbi:Hypothetical protein D9617_33g038160 [Elsinoe fawcettii]|nr:Hypothetical protein D9617_33g038160 [Elsinoe fawcettii]